MAGKLGAKNWAGINGSKIGREKLGGKFRRVTLEPKFRTQQFCGKFISH
jgi:hypothetical protein